LKTVGLWAGIAALASAARVGEVGDAVQGSIERAGAADGVLDRQAQARPHGGPEIGHAVVEDRGTLVHAPPDPVADVVVEDDDWTVTTVDGSDGAHWEHSVAVHEGGIWVLTAADGGAAGLAPYGVTPTPPA
jgi:methionyl aminopeptidase